MSNLASSQTRTDRDRSVEQAAEAALPTAKYPNTRFHHHILKVFAYFHSTRIFSGNQECDVNDLSFEGLYQAELKAESWFKYVTTSRIQQSRDGFGDAYVKQALALVEEIAHELRLIGDSGMRQAEGNRLAWEIGRRQAAAEEASRHFSRGVLTSQSGNKILKEWKKSEPWVRFMEMLLEGQFNQREVIQKTFKKKRISDWLADSRSRVGSVAEESIQSNVTGKVSDEDSKFAAEVERESWKSEGLQQPNYAESDYLSGGDAVRKRPIPTDSRQHSEGKLRLKKSRIDGSNPEINPQIVVNRASSEATGDSKALSQEGWRENPRIQSAPLTFLFAPYTNPSILTGVVNRQASTATLSSVNPFDAKSITSGSEG